MKKYTFTKFLIISFFILLFPTIVGAYFNNPASGTIYASSTTVNIGDIITITVTGQDNDGLRALGAHYGGDWHIQNVFSASAISKSWTTREDSPGIYRYCGKVVGSQPDQYSGDPDIYQINETVDTTPKCVSVTVSPFSINPPTTSNNYLACYNNDVYWYNQYGARMDLYQDCGYNQTCQNGQCQTVNIINQCTCGSWSNWQNQGCGQGPCSVNQIYQTRGRICNPRLCAQEIESTCTSSSVCYKPIAPTTAPSYIKYSKKGCFDDDLYWFDSKGIRQDKYQDCSDDNEETLDKCENAKCVNELTTACSTDCKAGGLIISILGKREKEDIQLAKNIKAGPEEKLDFLVIVKNFSQEEVNNATVKIELPDEIIYKGDLRINNKSFSGDIKSGINIGSLSPDGQKTITFKGEIRSKDIKEGEKEITGTVVAGDLSNSDSLKIGLNPSKGIATSGLAAIKYLFSQWYVWLLLILAGIFLVYVIFRNLFAVLA